MVVSYYVIKPFYLAIWHILKLFRKQRVVILYCEDAFDVTLFNNVQKNLKKIKIVAKNHTVARSIKNLGVSCHSMPSFPDAVIMFRNMAWKFPCRNILKFGFEHGAYNFKKFSKAYYYNMFNIFFMTSSHDVERVKKLGVTTAEAIGFPKIDSAFNGSISNEMIENLRNKLCLNPGKKTILFSATWDGSGMSAVELWYDKLTVLLSNYNILTTLHPWTSKKYYNTLRINPELHYIEDHELLQYIMLADCCIGDTNSLIAEFCLLDKPIITFKLLPTPRTLPDVISLLDRISVRIGSFDELPAALQHIFNTPMELSRYRKDAIRIFFDKPDGCAGLRAAHRICEHIPELALDK